MLLASRAEVLLNAGKELDALADITAAIAQRPDDTDMLWIKARIHMSRGQVDLAERDLEHAVSLDPSDRRTRLMKAQAQFRLGQFEGAVDDATQTLVISMGDPMARETRALALIALELDSILRGRASGPAGLLELAAERLEAGAVGERLSAIQLEQDEADPVFDFAAQAKAPIASAGAKPTAKARIRIQKLVEKFRRTRSNAVPCLASLGC